MIPMPASLAHLLGDVPADTLLLSLLVVSLLLIFAGSTVVKVVAFLVVGLAGAALGATLGAQYLPTTAGYLLGGLLGFVLGGIIGVALIALGIGLAIGYAAYILALDFAATHVIALVVGVAFFVIGVAFSTKILSVATAMAGGFLLFEALTTYGLGNGIATVIAAAATLAGLWVQLGLSRHASQPTATNVGGGQSDRL